MDLRDQQTKLTALVEQILNEAKRQGADQAEVTVSVDAGLAVSVRKGELENLEFNQDRGFGITLYCGQRKGSASTTDSSDSAISDTVAAAKNIASHTEEDPCNGLADPSLTLLRQCRGLLRFEPPIVKQIQLGKRPGHEAGVGEAVARVLFGV